jgi:hypothetical protein
VLAQAMVLLRQGALKETDAAAGERRDGVVGEGRAQEVAADSLELFAVAAVGGGRGADAGVQLRDLSPREFLQVHVLTAE